MTLEERIIRLEDIENIRYLQAKYQRCLDSRDFDSLAQCFTIDVKTSYNNGKLSFNGRDEAVKFLCDVMSPSMPSTHLIHGGEIDWIDNTSAKAKWYLEDTLLHQKYFLKLSGAAIYDCEYKKIDGLWYISKIGYERAFEYVTLRGPLSLLSMHKRTFIKRIKKADPNTLGEYGKYYQYKTLKKKKE